MKKRLIFIGLFFCIKEEKVVEEQAEMETVGNKKEVTFLIKPRALTFREVKKMDELKISERFLREYISEANLPKISEWGFARVDFFVEEIYQDESIYDWDNHVLNLFIDKTMGLTFGREETDQEKN